MIKYLNFYLVILAISALIIIPLHSYDVFYNGLFSTLVGGDSVNYLNGYFGSQNLFDFLNSDFSGSYGAVLSLFGISFISQLVVNIFGPYSLFAFIIINALIIALSFYNFRSSILSVCGIYAPIFLKTFSFFVCLFPLLFINYLTGPNKEVFTFLISSLLARSSSNLCIEYWSVGSSKFTFSSKFKILCRSLWPVLILVFFREAYLAIVLLYGGIVLSKNLFFRLIFISLFFSLLFYLRPDSYFSSIGLSGIQDSASIFEPILNLFNFPLGNIFTAMFMFFISSFAFLFSPDRIYSAVSGDFYLLTRLLHALMLIYLILVLFRRIPVLIKAKTLFVFPSLCLVSYFGIVLVFCQNNASVVRHIIPAFPLFLMAAITIRFAPLNSSSQINL